MSKSPGYLQYVPYESPYDHQREAMGEIDAALDSGSDILFEGACGTGKTIAALAPALAHARSTDKTVVITTNVHQQMYQFVEEASAIVAGEPISAIVVQGKDSMCHIDVGYEECQTLRDTTHELVDAERAVTALESRQRELLDKGQDGDKEATMARGEVMAELEAATETVEELAESATCDHYYQNLTSNTDEFYNWLAADVRTPEAIYDYADDRQLCGYELLKDGLADVDLVICNYHHLLDPFVRDQFFRWLGRSLDEVIAVFDEAHNVADAARDHAHHSIAERTVSRAVTEAQDCADPRSEAASRIVEAFLEALRTVRDNSDVTETDTAGGEWQDHSIENEDRRDELTMKLLEAYNGIDLRADIETALDLGEDLDEKYAKAYRRGETETRNECPLEQTAAFVERWLDEAPRFDTYPVVSVRQRTESQPASAARAELYTCLPKRVTAGLFDSLHAAVLMSATLRPFDVTSDVLGIDDPETLTYGPQFPPERRRTYAVDGPALFASRRDDTGVIETVTSVLEDVIHVTPGNTLVFCPSYAEAARYHGLVSEGTRYLDEPGQGATQLREQFVRDDSGALFTSLWGTLGEGVSYDGDDARSVVVVGVPYPHLDGRMEAVQSAYETAFSLADDAAANSAGWHYAVEVPTVRKTRQALGRIVRSPTDFGARVLLDARYTERASVEMPEYGVRGAFPPSERAEMVDVDPAKLRFGLLNFFSGLEAYDGDPPDPRPP